MYSTYDRNHICEFFALHSERINRAFCVGRKKEPNSSEVNFCLRFFIGLSPEDLKTINDLVKEGEDEVLVEFFQEIPGKPSRVLSEEEMRVFDFSREWSVKRLCTGWDELRDIGQNMMAIIFKPE